MAKKSDKKPLKERFSGKKISYLVIFLLFFVLLCCYPGSNLFTWISAKIEIRRQEKQIRHLQQEIIKMDSCISNLTGNKDSLEKFARETFHFAAPGEDVYIIYGEN